MNRTFLPAPRVSLVWCAASLVIFAHAARVAPELVDEVHYHRLAFAAAELVVVGVLVGMLLAVELLRAGTRSGPG